MVLLEAAAWAGNQSVFDELHVIAEPGDVDARYVRAIEAWRRARELPVDAALRDYRPNWTRFPWISLLMTASAAEAEGKLDIAESRYRYALHAMPNWIPEARMTWEKLQVLNRSRLPGHARGRNSGSPDTSVGA
jgi:hypothetical protein